MNALIQLIALILTVWATWWFLEHSSPVVALGVAGISLLLLLWLIQSIIEDIGDAANEVRSRRRGRKVRTGRE